MLFTGPLSRFFRPDWERARQKRLQDPLTPREVFGFLTCHRKAVSSSPRCYSDILGFFCSSVQADAYANLLVFRVWRNLPELSNQFPEGIRRYYVRMPAVSYFGCTFHRCDAYPANKDSGYFSTVWVQRRRFRNLLEASFRES